MSDTQEIEIKEEFKSLYEDHKEAKEVMAKSQFELDAFGGDLLIGGHTKALKLFKKLRKTLPLDLFLKKSNGESVETNKTTLGYTDKQLLDALQSLNDEANHTGRCTLRMSTTGRGWRLHETDQMCAKKDVRLAIATYLQRGDDGKH